ncbi:ribosomal protein S18-alanine N-acetyltransferase [Vacuolonema iberomarrocanum]|uniref:ribosomal protein S18-alanine N-acetyltransferase n=1 Tax=Vacuolonema iberomarrocanum TaxID=3454632 RepID=UPI0019FADE54|nr:ribosomal protein S18-alanine N-acetyltransferase [filamentous cyanobacterium LEGE 07170]
MSRLYLQLLTPEQVTAAVELDRRCLGGMWSADGYLREIESPNGLLLGLTEGRDRPHAATPLIGLGCLWMVLDEAHITVLVVDEPYRGQGLGRTLLGALLAQARQRQMTRATLEVRASNRRAIAIYHQSGFQEAGRRKAYYKNPVEDACILWRKGLQTDEFVESLAAWQESARDRRQRWGWELVRTLPTSPVGEGQITQR